MKITIEEVNNGFIYRIDDGQNISNEVFECDIDTISGVKKLLENLIYDLCPGSRYDDSRLHVVIAPGDKSSKYTVEHEKLLWGDPEERGNGEI